MGLLALFSDRKKKPRGVPEGVAFDPGEIVPEVADEGASIRIENSRNVTVLSGSNLNILVVRKDHGRDMP